jgi:uncharacterized membrane protein YdbT with pleckstrin-like domain
MIKNIRKWLKQRFLEPSSWVALSVCVLSLGFVFNSWLSFFVLLAVLISLAGIFLKERGGF